MITSALGIIAKLFINDWKNKLDHPIKGFDLIIKDISITSLRDVIYLRNFFNLNPSFNEGLLFLTSENYCSLTSILEVSIMNDKWTLVGKLTELENIQYCYLGKQTKFHIHEVIFSRFLELLKEGNLPPEEFYRVVQLKLRRQYIGNSLFFKLKQIFSEEMKNCQAGRSPGKCSKYLKNLLEFVFFLKENHLVDEDFFSFLVKDAIKYQNFYVLKYLEFYLPLELCWTVFSSLNFNFIEQVYSFFPAKFPKQGYLKYIIKCFFENPMADESELYSIINWLKHKDLDNFSVDNSFLSLIICSLYHCQAKVLLINHLISLKVVSRNKFLLDNLKNTPRIHPMIFEALAAGENLKDLSLSILGSKSWKKMNVLEPLLLDLNKDENQNKILFCYIAINHLKINKDIVFNNLNQVPNFKDVKLTTINQLVFVLNFYKEDRRLKFLLSVDKNIELSVETSFEVLSIIKNNDLPGLKVPGKPKSLKDLAQNLSPLKKIIQDSNVNLGLDNFAKKIENLKFKDFKIKVPRTAQDLRDVGLSFKNCLAVDRHSRYVSDIITRNMIIFTLENEQIKYCICINPYQEKIVEAKKMQQEVMETSVQQSLEFFLRDVQYGQNWL